MSHSASIDITFYDAPMVKDVIQALEAVGWQLTISDRPLWIPFDEDGALDPEVVDAASREDMLRLFQAQVANGATFSTPMYWNGADSIWLIIAQPYKTLTCSINNADRRLVDPNSRLTNLRWYYQHVVLPLERDVDMLKSVVATDFF